MSKVISILIVSMLLFTASVVLAVQATSSIWLHTEDRYIGQYNQYSITSLHDDEHHILCYISSSNTNSTTSISCVKLDSK